MITIAFVEDDNDFQKELSFHLGRRGFDIQSFSTANEFRVYKQQDHKIDILLLDLNLPDEDGLTLLSDLQDKRGTGIVILSGRTEPDDRIKGLEIGADAYLTKPVQLIELCTVIKCIARRIQIESSQGPMHCLPTYQLCSNKRYLNLPDGKQVSLTAKEGIVLHSLAQKAPDVVSRRLLTESLGEDFWHYDERKLEAIVSRLRRKLNRFSHQIPSIKAARGSGYQLLLNVTIGTAQH